MSIDGSDSRSSTSNLLTWDCHSTLCTWTHTLVHSHSWQLSHVRDNTGYGELYMKVMSRSTWNRSLLVRRESIQLISIRWWFRESLIKVEILEMVSNIDISESSLVDWARNEYIIGIDKFPYPYVYSGCQMIERSNYMVTLYWRVILVFHQKFHIFRVGMIRC